MDVAVTVDGTLVAGSEVGYDGLQVNAVLGGGIWSTPAYFNNHVYFSPVYDTLKSFSYSSARLSTAPVASTAVTFVPPGALPVVSANGTANAIVWAHQNTDPAVLYAFDANTLAQLYSSSTAAKR